MIQGSLQRAAATPVRLCMYVCMYMYVCARVRARVRAKCVGVCSCVHGPPGACHTAKDLLELPSIKLVQLNVCTHTQTLSASSPVDSDG